MQKQYPDSYLGEDEMADVRKHMIFHGRVQGVGFRYTAKYLARSMNLTGWVKNEYDGTVVMEVQGRESNDLRTDERTEQESVLSRSTGSIQKRRKQKQKAVLK